MSPLDGVRGVVFDLDGTLVHSAHDYAALKAELGLPAELAVLEGIAHRPPAERPALLARVHAWEQALAEAATALPGAAPVLEHLARTGVRRGILTRNTRATALATLASTGLMPWFDPLEVVGRDEAAPKPSPAGVVLLLLRWGLPSRDAALVGDFRFDLQAARAAGVRAIGFDPARTGALDPLADHVVHALHALLTG